MKILYVVLDPGIPLRGLKGAGVHVRALAGAFAEMGHDVTVAASDLAGPEPLHTGLRVAHISSGESAEALASVSNEGKAELRSLFQNVEAYRTLTDLMLAERPHAVLERLSLFSLGALAASRSAKVPHLLEVDAPLADEAATYRRLSLRETARFLEKTVICGADKVFPVSTALRDWVVKLGVKHEKVRVLSNGVDTKLFDPSRANDRRREFGLDGAQVLGFVGSLRPWHGVELLMKAFSLLAARNTEVRLLVVGDGPARENLMRWRNEEGLTDRVLMAGPVAQSQVPGFLATMDVVFAPYENVPNFYFSPLKILESMAMGRPIVASAIGDIPQLVLDGRAGLLVPPGDADALASAAQRLLSDPKMGSQLGAAARECAVQYHDWRVVARRVIESSQQH